MTDSIKNILQLVKSEAKILAIFLFNLSMWSWQFFAGINLIIVPLFRQAGYFDNFLIFTGNTFLVIFMAKSYAYYLLLKEQLHYERERRMWLEKRLFELEDKLTIAKTESEEGLKNMDSWLNKAADTYYEATGTNLF